MKRSSLPVPLTAVAWLMLAAPASGAVGDLAFRDCVKDVAPGECGSTAEGLDNPRSVAVSPDNRSVYAVSEVDDAIVTFGRNPSTGALSNPSCIKDAAPGECGSAADGLNDARTVAVSPDGKSVYVASFDDDAIVTFDRNPSTGALSNPSCIKNAAPGECGSSAPGLNGAFGVTVSPDGKSVYVGALGAIVRFDRNTSTGALSNASCIGNEVPGACGSAAQGLDGAFSVAVSPDNRSVYVASFHDDAIVRFDRDTATGGLSDPRCISDAVAGEPACASSAEGLDGPRAVTVSPDARSVYAASGTDGAIVRFDRNISTGALANPSCVKDAALGECSSAANGLADAQSVAVSPDNRSVYVSSGNDSAIVRFKRNLATGGLFDPTCIKDLAPGECSSAAEGLNDARSTAVSPDGRSVYVAAFDDDAISRFDREPQPPSPSPSPLPGGEDTPPRGGDGPSSNEFSFGKTNKNKKRGTAKLTLRVPGAGDLALARTKKVKGMAKRAQVAGEVKLPVKPKGSAKKKLNAKGMAKVKAEVTFTPDGGESNPQSKRLKLVKRRP